VPAPLDDIAWDGWLFHRLFSIVSTAWAVTAAGVSTAGMSDQQTVRFEIDSKAMRKMKATDGLIGVVQFSGEVGTVTAKAVLNSRVLTLLS